MKVILSAAIVTALCFPVIALAADCPNLTRTLSLGARDFSTNGEVSRLQLFLAQYFGLDQRTYVTGYFGGLTRENVRRFQCATMGICSGSENTNGYGLVGRLTRSTIAQYCTQTAASVPPPATPATGQQPVCVLSASPASVLAGESAQISWTSSNSPAGTVVPDIGAVGPSGSKSLRLLTTTTFTGTFTANSGAAATCSVTVGVLALRDPMPAACSFNGQTLAHGATVTAYQSISVGAGQVCQQETRTCSSGVLSGSYQYASCSVQQPSASASCTFNGQALVHGAFVTAYESASVPAGSSCVSETRTCSNGALSGSYGYPSCIVLAAAPPSNSTFKSISVSHTSQSGFVQFELRTIPNLPEGSAYATVQQYYQTIKAFDLDVGFKFDPGDGTPARSPVSAGIAGWYEPAAMTFHSTYSYQYQSHGTFAPKWIFNNQVIATDSATY